MPPISLKRKLAQDLEMSETLRERALRKFRCALPKGFRPELQTKQIAPRTPHLGIQKGGRSAAAKKVRTAHRPGSKSTKSGAPPLPSASKYGPHNPHPLAGRVCYDSVMFLPDGETRYGRYDQWGYIEYVDE